MSWDHDEWFANEWKHHLLKLLWDLNEKIMKKIIEITLRSKWIMCCWWMYATASTICRMKAAHAFSVKTNSSSITRSKSSPPPILKKLQVIFNNGFWLCCLSFNVFVLYFEGFFMLFKIQIQNDSQFEIRLTKKSFSC